MVNETEIKIPDNRSLQSIIIALAGFLVSGGKLSELPNGVIRDLDIVVSIELSKRQGHIH